MPAPDPPLAFRRSTTVALGDLTLALPGGMRDWSIIAAVVAAMILAFMCCCHRRIRPRPPPSAREEREAERLQKEREREEQRRQEEEEERKRQIEDATRGDRTVMIVCLHHKADERDVYEFFSTNAGKVRDVQIIRDARTGRSKGLAYIEFYLQESTLKALALSGHPVKG